MSGIADWLTGLGLAKHVELFHANDIDLDVLPSLSEEEFKELGLSLGDRKRLMKGIAQLAATAQAAAEAKPSVEEAPAAERRQLTIVFVDLVDSTVLSRALDPEDLRDAIQGYHHAVAAAIREAGGFVAKFMGDGVLAYFGYPHATEDAAERAVRAGLHVLAAVRALPAANGHRLAARAGIATGPVVVGDVIGENIAREVNVVGETPNLAARLQAVGPVDSIVIAGSTRQLIGDLFILEVLEPQRLKGFAEPVLASGCGMSGRGSAASKQRAACRKPHPSSAERWKSACCWTAGDKPRPAMGSWFCFPASRESANPASPTLFGAPLPRATIIGSAFNARPSTATRRSIRQSPTSRRRRSSMRPTTTKRVVRPCDRPCRASAATSRR